MDNFSIDGRCMSCGTTCNTAGCPNVNCPDKKPRTVTTPQYVKSLMDLLTDAERYTIIHEYCRGCGSTDTGCQCWNDE